MGLALGVVGIPAGLDSQRLMGRLLAEVLSAISRNCFLLIPFDILICLSLISFLLLVIEVPPQYSVLLERNGFLQLHTTPLK